MITLRWLEKRKQHWSRLEQLVNRAGGRPAALAHNELRELGLLYRQTAADLSGVREDPISQRFAGYLNQLLGRAHNLVYSGEGRGSGGIVHFYRVTYPAIFRETFNYTLTATIMFLVAAVVGFLVTLAEPTFPRFMLNGQMADTIERRQMWTHSILSMKPAASSAIMTNNMAVGFAAFAMGITAGVGTTFMMIFNGMLIGVIGAACWQSGMSEKLWSFVAPHGVLELPAIFIAGGAGLMLARGLLFPGILPRRASLELAGGKAVRLALGTIPLLVIAGIIEGFLSPTELPASMKFLFAGALGVLFVIYLNSGRTKPAAKPEKVPSK